MRLAIPHTATIAGKKDFLLSLLLLSGISLLSSNSSAQGAIYPRYDAITGDISGWWDHSISEKPYRLYIEAKPGGGFDVKRTISLPNTFVRPLPSLSHSR